MATRTPKTTTHKKTAVIASKAKQSIQMQGKDNLLDARVFSYDVNPSLLTQVLHIYRDNTHQNTSKVKTRGELTRTTKKIYKQKGTGNARHGSRMSPTFVGGGVAFGPTGVKPNNLKINRKMKAAALAGILTLYAKDKKVELIALPDVKTLKTKIASSLLPKDDTLLVYHQEGGSLVSSTKNLNNLTTVEVGCLNAFQIASSKHVVFTTAAHQNLVARLLPLLKTKAK